MATAVAKAPIVCPVCRGENPSDAVFCGNPARVTAFVGKPHFLVMHALWFAAWVALNTGILAVMTHFDEYPFGLLGIILAIEAIFITGFLLISQNRQNTHADKRAELDYGVNVRTYREIHEIDAMLRTVVDRLEKLEAAIRSGVR
jgi:uncharacterized membrane protein